MKIAELREYTKKSRPEDLQKALAQVYKALPKAKKEELDPDLILILEGKETTPKKKNDNVLDFETVKQRIELLIEDAMAGYYIQPNRVIPKAMRSRWRFSVKKYYKALLAIPPESEHYEESNQLLADLYRLMCYGCMYYIFNTNDTFTSAQIEQNDYFAIMTDRILLKEISSETIHTLLDLAVLPGVSYDSVEIDHLYILFHHLHTDDAFRAVIIESKKIIAEKEKKAVELEKSNTFSDTAIYYLHDSCNNLADAVLMAASCLGIAGQEFEWYFEHSSEREKEITLYRAIVYCFRPLNDHQNIVAVYDYAVKKYKVNPRDELKEMYDAAKKNL